ncbi:condensation domain-containing protein [Saccharothrix australiensis]|uniref:Phosphopantetheine binding protein n=1 Tax=Saccharothrix australiensis TaxID=2072 RepID=A0A495VYB5_9PSEU|nr:condensation domain-containing protein [Saccharothrix australiensis]RKT54239.1 phosphopantetheine binding protein [Saccharothrix australiensis]
MATDIRRTEDLLVDIWSEVLGVEVTRSDNFFDLGGDSILAIQVVAKAAAAGLAVGPTQLISHQTVAELALVTSEVDGGARVPLPEGSLPLTAIQRELLRRQPHPEHYNQSVLLACEQPDVEALRAAFHAVVAHHDAFALRFGVTDGEPAWQWYERDTEPPPFDVVTTRVGEDPATLLQRCTARSQATLDPGAGPVVRATLLDLGPAGHRLFLVAHHLVVDSVSWRILIDDLTTAYRQLRAGRPVALPPPGTPFGTWARLMAEHAGDPDCGGELDLWRDRAARSSALPWADHSRDRWPAQRIDEATTWSAELDEDTTSLLLARVRRLPDVPVEAVLLGAVATAAGRCADAGSVTIDVERHGREPLFPEVDVSRTVGWFTQVHPVVVPVSGGTGRAAEAAARELRSTPCGGVRFGLLAARDEVLAGAPLPGVLFNYLGRATGGQAGPLTEVAEPVGPDREPANLLTHPVEFIAAIDGGRLHITVTCAGMAPERSRAEPLGRACVAALAELVEPATGVRS